MDFTIETYTKLLEILQKKGFVFQSFVGFIQNQGKKVIILRHDVDKLPENSLNIARLESSLGVSGSYYFRTVPCSYSEEIIRKVAELGHEVGYHYEDASLAAERIKGKGERRKWGKDKRQKSQDKRQKKKGNEEYKRFLAEIAIESFKENLAKLREIVPVKTICMHGSPLSKWDSRLLWKYYDYRDFGIIGEPYFDIDFNKVFYITDTGRRWDGKKVSIRDKPQAPLNTRWPTYHSTFDIIKALNEGIFPDIAMMTIHPQRWTNNQILWLKELIIQNLKNQVKYFLVK